VSLTRQFNYVLYELLALSKGKNGNKELAEKRKKVAKPTDILESHYVMEFLELKEEYCYSEADLETAIINKTATSNKLLLSSV
jgi:predicted nuclease of restriction endonuclease-like (RecB) superfamily